MNGVLRVGIIGIGFGAEVHAPAFQRIEGCELVAFLGTGGPRSGEISERFGCPVDVDLNSFLGRDLDIVTVALPPTEVAPAISAITSAKIPILCEKPLGCSATEATQLETQTRGLVTAVDFEFAEIPAFAHLKSMIEESELGEVRFIQLTWLTESYAQKKRKWSWKTDANKGGGVLTLLGTHALYIAEWLVGPVAKVRADLSNKRTSLFKPTEADVAAEDTAFVQMRFVGSASFAGTIGNAHPGSHIHQWIVVGENGTAILENRTSDYTSGFTLNLYDADGRERQSLADPRADGDGRIAPFLSLANRFVDSVRNGTQCRPDFGAGRRVAALTEAIRRSHIAGSWETPHDI
ncbi:Gfo/Idh/MocA family protein [Rhodoplanes elegans]|nr:Gfo/Idh/MocA family oxidoreductase [Rhodoplanes elegans]